jgi:hypothetical protein
MTTPDRNHNKRSLDVIAAEIHKHRRVDMFACGRLLNEARDYCEHGEWLDWLEDNFEWSVETASRYMAVDKLAAQIPTLRNLKLAKTTFYALADEQEDLQPVLVDALAARATKTFLKPAEADAVMHLASLRHEYGDYPEATLRAMYKSRFGRSKGEADEIIAELKAQKPSTKEAADAIIAEFEQIESGKAPAEDNGGNPQGSADKMKDKIAALDELDELDEPEDEPEDEPVAEATPEDEPVAEATPEDEPVAAATPEEKIAQFMTMFVDCAMRGLVAELDSFHAACLLGRIKKAVDALALEVALDASNEAA